jgi:hypothetical protein
MLDLLRLLRLLSRKQKRVFNLQEMVRLTGGSPAATGMALIRAQNRGVIERVGGSWINLEDPPSLEQIAFFLVSPSYISFESALYRHGILSQSPRGALTVATLGRPRRITTSLGVIQFFHLKKEIFGQFDSQRLALPEKSWLDFVYLRGLKGEREFTETYYFDHLDPKKMKKFSLPFPGWVQKRSLDILKKGKG